MGTHIVLKLHERYLKNLKKYGFIDNTVFSIDSIK